MIHRRSQFPAAALAPRCLLRTRRLRRSLIRPLSRSTLGRPASQSYMRNCSKLQTKYPSRPTSSTIEESLPFKGYSFSSSTTPFPSNSSGAVPVGSLWGTAISILPLITALLPSWIIFPRTRGSGQLCRGSRSCSKLSLGSLSSNSSKLLPYL